MKTKNLKEIVYDSVLESIYSSEYKPNEIITENALIEKFGFSKSPVREALISLCHEGVLKSIPRCGYEIIALTTDDIHYMQQYRLVLETNFLRLSQPFVTREKLAELEQLNELCCKKTEHVIEHWQYNSTFHIRLLSLAGNPFACKELERCMSILWRAYAQRHWNEWSSYPATSDIKNHAAILQYLKEGQIEDAVQCLQQDLHDFGI